jgi:hypothetical protein
MYVVFLKLKRHHIEVPCSVYNQNACYNCKTVVILNTTSFRVVKRLGTCGLTTFCNGD